MGIANKIGAPIAGSVVASLFGAGELTPGGAPAAQTVGVTPTTINLTAGTRQITFDNAGDVYLRFGAVAPTEGARVYIATGEKTVGVPAGATQMTLLAVNPTDVEIDYSESTAEYRYLNPHLMYGSDNEAATYHVAATIETPALPIITTALFYVGATVAGSYAYALHCSDGSTNAHRVGMGVYFDTADDVRPSLDWNTPTETILQQVEAAAGYADESFIAQTVQFANADQDLHAFDGTTEKNLTFSNALTEQNAAMDTLFLLRRFVPGSAYMPADSGVVYGALMAGESTRPTDAETQSLRTGTWIGKALSGKAVRCAPLYDNDFGLIDISGLNSTFSAARPLSTADITTLPAIAASNVPNYIDGNNTADVDYDDSAPTVSTALVNAEGIYRVYSPHNLSVSLRDAADAEITTTTIAAGTAERLFIPFDTANVRVHTTDAGQIGTANFVPILSE